MRRRNSPIDSEMRTVSAFTVRSELPLSRIRNHRAEPRLPTTSTSIAITTILKSNLECLRLSPSLLFGIRTFYRSPIGSTTLLLKPAIVTLHLLGGMLTLSLLVWLALREVEWRPLPPGEMLARLRPWAVLALVVGFGQMALGGWVSTNYAALACTDFPT
jgi:hypothetical protein